jgi:hypothetical protein
MRSGLRADTIGEMGQLAPNDDFPNVVLQSHDGVIELGDRWREGPLVVAFMRHFG